MTTAHDSLRAGDLDAALAQLTEQVKKEPGAAKHRVFLFQLLSVIGRWDRALAALKVSGDLDASTLAMVQTYREALRDEVIRAQIFAGQRAPIIFGKPEEWIAYLINALQLDGQGKHAEAAQVRAKAFEAAPATKGTIDGQPFEWIADADSRLGPMLEVILNGRYQWIPFSRMRGIKLEAPVDLRDMVWTPAFVTLSTGAEMPGLIPTRYPGSENSSDNRLRLSRMTDWKEVADGSFHGLGQRMLATDRGDHPLLDIRVLTFDIPLELTTPDTEIAQQQEDTREAASEARSEPEASGGGQDGLAPPLTR